MYVVLISSVQCHSPWISFRWREHKGQLRTHPGKGARATGRRLALLSLLLALSLDVTLTLVLWLVLLVVGILIVLGLSRWS